MGGQEEQLKEVLQGLPVTPGEALLILRKRAGLSQAQLAEKAGIARESVSKLERGDGFPHVTMVTLQKAFGAVGAQVVVRYTRGGGR